MKRIIYLSLLTFSAFILFSNSNGTFTADHIGSTGLGQSCAQIGCHDGGGGTQGVDTNRLVIRVLNASNTDVTAYTPGQQYNIEIAFKLFGCTKLGFQCTALGFPSNAKAGNVSNTTMPTLIQMYTDGTGREYMSHTTAGNGSAVISGGYATWKYKWTAPATGAEAVFFHVAVNRTNNDLTTAGDSIFLSNKVLQKPTAVSDLTTNINIQVYPNPCSNQLMINSNGVELDEYSVFDLTGRMIIHATAMNASNIIPVNNWVNGNYILLLKANGKTYSQLVSKK